MGIKIKQVTGERNKEVTSSFEDLLKKEIHLFGPSFSEKKKENFYSELSVLLRSGINLKESLDLIGEMYQKEKDKQIIEKLNKALVEGRSFGDALRAEKSFSPYEYHAVKIGEQTGQLAFVTADLADYYQRKNEQKRQIISSLTYPVIVLLTSIIVVFFMLKYVVPMFEDIFEQNRVELPFLTQVIVRLSQILENNGLFIISTCILILVGFNFVKNKKWFKRLSGNLLLKMPVLGKYARKIYLARFTHTMMLLTNSKIPVVNGLSLVREMIDFHPLQNSLKEIETDILNGRRMSTSFGHHGIFDKKIIALLKVAEETNQTEFVFQKLYEQYDQEVKYQAQTLSNILNPLLTLMVGLIVGVILIAMYLPMFRLSSVIG